MHKTYIKYILFAFLYLLTSNKSKGQNQTNNINGITVICPPDSIINNPFDEIKSLGANWTCIVPYRNCELSNFQIAKEDVFGWWGLSIEGIETSIQMAKQSGLKIFLKPQLYLENSWPGTIDFKTEKEWQNWEKQYTDFIMTFLDLAIKHDVDMFCIGTEIKNSIRKRENYWLNLIENIRYKYKGQLIYSANWDAYQNVDFWDKLDLVGISSYFPLSDDINASPTELRKRWVPYLRSLRRFYSHNRKPILFTEYGYLSVDRAAYRHWEHEDNIANLAVNETAQANALETLYAIWMEESIWAGGFLWKWYPDKKGHQGYFEKDYTPQGKKAEGVIKKWFTK